MPKPNKTRLIRAALLARTRAVAPYSKFKVGAALLTDRGEIITGANVESVSYGLTCCAERIALFQALTAGKKNFSVIGGTIEAKFQRAGSKIVTPAQTDRAGLRA